MALEQKFVPAANWAAQPFLGKQIVLIDENDRLGLWDGAAYTPVGAGVGGYLGPVANEAAMLLVTGVAGQFVKRTDTNTNWQLDSNTDPEDTSGERLARWRNLGVTVPDLDAANVTLADAGGHWAGGDLETAMQEAGTRLEALEDPPLADLWNYLLGLNDSTTVTPFGIGLGQFGTTTLGSAGMAMSTVSGGTAASVSFADTNVVTRNPHVQYDSAAGPSGICGVRSPTVGVISTTAGRGGCYVRFRVAAKDAAPVANAGCFYGVRMTTSDWSGATDFSSLTSCVGFGVASGGTNLQLMHNDGSGAVNTVALAENWPAHDPAEAYEVTLNNPPGTRNWEWSIKRISTGVTLSGTLDAGTAELPSADSTPAVHLLRRTGTTALAVSLGFYFCARGRIDLPALADIIGGTGGGIDLANPNPFTVTQGTTAVNLGNLSGTVTLNARASNTQYGTLTGNVTFAVPTGGRSGDKLTIALKQDGTGSRSITMNASIKPMVGGATLLASTLANTLDFLYLEYVDADAGWRYSFVNGTV